MYCRLIMASMLALSYVACAPRSSEPDTRPSAQRLEPTRSGPACDSLAARVAAHPDSFEVVPPLILSAILPPAPRPAYVRGRTFRVSFVVGTDGAIDSTSVTITPDMGGYRSQFERTLFRVRYTPAILDGCAVPGTTYLNFTL
jgi:hypothetical protein